MKYAILDATGTVTAIVDIDPRSALADNWTPLAPGMVVGAKLVNGVWTTSPPPSTSYKAAGDLASLAETRMTNALALQAQAAALGVPPDETPPDEAAIYQGLADGIVLAARWLWTVAACLGMKDDLPPAA